MPRGDITNKLIHFTSGASPDDAFARLRNIIRERRLIAGNRMIRGSYMCVCFTEAPLAAVADGFVSCFPYARYAPFGLMFDKTMVFARGGRPVIYQPEAEFNGLPEVIRWRHVRYEPIGEDMIDFTWEREWRIQCSELQFTPDDAVIVLPNGEWQSLLLEMHDWEQDTCVEAYSTVVDREIAEQLREEFRWRIVTLS